MISPSSWVKRLGVGGQLAPLFKCVLVYLVAQGVAGESEPSVEAAACKCAPLLCLLAALLYRVSTQPPDKRSYCVMVSLGLALSAIGDALLVWPSQLESGMLMFGLAHVCYIEAFGWRSSSPWYPGTAVTVYLAAAVYVAAVPPPPALRFLVPAYATLLATMAWRGAARGGWAAAGAALFLVSDAVLGYSLFAGPVPHDQVIVMSTYYMAQLCIAYTALRDSPGDSPPSAAPASTTAAHG